MANGEATPGAAAPEMEEEDFDADFNAGFGGESTPVTETPAVVELEDQAHAPEVAPKAAEETPAAMPEPTAAPVAAAAPKKVEVDESELAALRQQAATSTEQLAAMNRQFDKVFGQVGNLKQVIEKLRTETPAGETVTLTEADVKELSEEYPEIAKLQLKVLNNALSKFKGTGSADVEKLVSERVQSALADTQDMVLNAVLPEWQDEVKKPQFGEWLKAQDPAVRALADSNRVNDAARMLRLYDRHLSAPAPVVKAPAPTPTPAPVRAPGGTERQRRIAAAVTPRGDGAPSSKASEVDDFEAGFRSG